MLILFFFACSIIGGFSGAPADSTDATEILVEVPKGATPRGLGPALEAAQVIDDAQAFSWYVRIHKEGACIKAGKHLVSRAMDHSSIIKALCGVPFVDTVPFTVIEGWRIREIDQALTRAGHAHAGEYAALAKTPRAFKAGYPLPSRSLEGYLFPETYAIEPGNFDTRKFIQRQLDMFHTRFMAKHPDGFGTRSLEDVVIMASMIVREEPTEAQRPTIAGILWKRIDNSWHLGVDATSRYTLPKWNDRRAFLKKLRDPSDPYNTRLRSGLPPTAIGNPDLSSLEAAAAPVSSPYWYYLHDSRGVLHPGRSVAEHEAFRRKYNVY
jgi:UPF0755 protein